MNLTYTVKYLRAVFLIFAIHNFGKAQDLHYSQFYNSPLNLNPAHSGIFNGDQRYMASFRDQWRFVPVAWTTFTGAYDQKIYPKNSDKYFYGVGINFNYDKQGLSSLNLMGLNVSGSYTRSLAKNHLVTGGLLLGFSSRGFNTNSLTWDKQWNGVAIDPTLGSGETFDLSRLYFLETAAGVNYRFQKDKRTKFDIGAAAFHLMEPKTNFYDFETQKLPRRYNFTALATVKVASPLDIQLHGMHQIQGKYSESIIGALAKIYINQQRGKETELHVGMGYRTAGSFIPTLALEYKNWYVGMSYDIDKTDFNQLLSSKGGPEFHIRYIIQKVRPINTRKNCPIY